MNEIHVKLKNQYDVYVEHIGKFEDSLCVCTKLYEDSVSKISKYDNFVTLEKYTSNKDLNIIDITDGVQVIPEYCFYDCKNLSSVKIPDTTLAIMDQAFMNCESIIDIHIPDSVVYIGKRAFQNCKNLKSINIPKSLFGISHKTFFNCESLISVDIGDNVCCVGDDSFYNCKSLSKVNLSKNLGGIFCGSFENCISLNQIYLPDDCVFSRLGRAFTGCTNLETINIPNTVRHMDHSIFSGCKLKNVIISEEKLNEFGDRFKLYLYYKNTDKTIYDDF